MKAERKYLVVFSDDVERVLRVDEVLKSDGTMHAHGHVIIVTTTMTFLLEKFADGFDVLVGVVSMEVAFGVLENVFDVEHLRIDDIRSDESEANDENFSGLSSGGFWLCGLNFFKEFIHSPDERVVISRSEDLGNKSSSLSQNGSSSL
jgi:hypothetical protein